MQWGELFLLRVYDPNRILTESLLNHEILSENRNWHRVEPLVHCSRPFLLLMFTILVNLVKGKTPHDDHTYSYTMQLMIKTYTKMRRICSSSPDMYQIAKHFTFVFQKLVVRPVKTDFMFYISSRVRFSPNSGKICTNSYFAIFLVAFQFSKFLLNMLSTLVLFYSFSSLYGCMWHQRPDKEGIHPNCPCLIPRENCTNLGFG